LKVDGIGYFVFRILEPERLKNGCPVGVGLMEGGVDIVEEAIAVCK